MSHVLILASSSPVRARLLQAAGVPFETRAARMDEPAIRASLLAESATPRDIADTLAELKALRVAARFPGALVIGCDQVLAFGTEILGKPESPADARAQLCLLRNRTHRLLSAVVICDNEKPVWRHVGEARMTMRDFSEDWLDGYLARNWDSVRDSVGCYHLEAEGIRLFSRIEGDYFTVLGLPLLELLSYLALRGTIAS
jgi:septum formation protein